MAASTSNTATAARPSQRKSAPRTSRAVLRDVEPGSTVECAHCGERVKFQAKVRNRQVICNVYKKGVWDRVEHFHADCYGPAGEPHGPVDTTPVVRNRARAAETKTA
jgi:hypothetical protein